MHFTRKRIEYVITIFILIAMIAMPVAQSGILQVTRCEYYDLDTDTEGAGHITLQPFRWQYPYGTHVLVTAVPDPGWEFDHWEKDLSGSQNPVTLVMTRDWDIEAHFSPGCHYTLTTNVDGSGTVTRNPDSNQYIPGTTVTITANPSPGWEFSHWSGDVTGSNNPETIVMDSNKIVTAHFVEITYTLTTYITGCGSIIRDPDLPEYSADSSVELTAVPDSGWTFSHWEDDLTGSTNPQTLTMDSNKTVTAVFTEDQYALTVNIVGNGIVNRYPDQTSYLYGDSVELTAVADSGWTFDHWEDDLTGSTNPETITMDSDKTVTAVFTEDQYALTVNIVGNGDIILDPDQTYYGYGDSVELTAVADSGWTFSHWEDDLTGSTNPETITMDSDKTVTAVFTEDQYILTVNIIGDGIVDINPDQTTYLYGEVVDLTAIPDTGWLFSHWEDDLTGSDNPTSIVMDSDKTVTCVFTQASFVLTVNIDGAGSVTKNPDQITYTYGQPVELTAVADVGWTFSHWEDDLTGSTNPETITMDSDKTVTAVFTENLYQIVTSVEGNGSIALIPDQSFYTYGQNVECFAIADPGWTFDHWEEDLSGDINPQMLYIDGEKSIKAVFTQDEYILTINTIGTGYGAVAVSPNNLYYVYGDVVQLEAMPCVNSTFEGWTGDVASSSTVVSLFMDGDKTVDAEFTIVPNDPPLKPQTPAGPDMVVIGYEGIYTSYTTDPNNDDISYRFDWDADGSHEYGDWSNEIPSGSTIAQNKTWGVNGSFTVKVQARDIYGAESPWSDGLVVVVTGYNNPPNTPEIPEGPITVEVNSTVKYTSWTTDPDGDDVQYWFFWDDGNMYPSWTPFYPSGDVVLVQHIWDEVGTYYIRVQARDIYGAVSSFSEPLLVRVVSDLNNPPNIPSYPSPPDNSWGVHFDPTVSWVGGDPDGDAVTYDVYFEAGDINPELVSMDQTYLTYCPGILEPDTTYYWKIVAEDEHGAISSGPVWSFSTGDGIPFSILHTEGEIIWLNVSHGATLTGQFSVENLGYPGTTLDWVIESYPDWGSWSFDPEEGFNLSTEDDPTVVTATMVTPKARLLPINSDKSDTFTGQIILRNLHGGNQTGIVNVTLIYEPQQTIWQKILLYIRDILSQLIGIDIAEIFPDLFR